MARAVDADDEIRTRPQARAVAAGTRRAIDGGGVRGPSRLVRQAREIREHAARRAPRATDDRAVVVETVAATTRTGGARVEVAGAAEKDRTMRARGGAHSGHAPGEVHAATPAHALEPAIAGEDLRDLAEVAEGDGS